MSDTTFTVGQKVAVPRACRLPAVEELLGTGTILRVVDTATMTLYSVEGFPCLPDGRVLRPGVY